MAAGDTAAPSTTWSSLRYPIFRAFWATSLLSFFGATMQNMGAQWLMAELTDSPLMVSLVQSSMNFSIFLVSLPGGVIADMFDRRLVMLGSLVTMMMTTSLIGVLAIMGIITPVALLLITFVFGMAAAFMSPAYQASLPTLVPRSQLPSALTLGSMANSSARAIGPAIAGSALGAIGAGWMLLLNTLSFVGQSKVLLDWDNAQKENKDGESFNRSMLVGLRYVRYSPDIVFLMIRGGGNYFFASALLALLPMVVKVNLDGEPETFGFLLFAFGIGAFVSTLSLSTLYKWTSRNTVVTIAASIHALCLYVIGTITNFYVVAGAMLFAGGSMTMLLTSLMIMTQLILPEWVRARGISISFMATMGSLALGAAVWGQIAEVTSLGQSFVIASGMGLAAALLTHLFNVKDDQGREIDLAGIEPAARPDELAHDHRGAVKVELDYRIEPEAREDFAATMNIVRLLRLRNGSKDWSLNGDPNKPGQFTESFVERDWNAYLRHIQRITIDESHALDRAAAFHLAADAPAPRFSPNFAVNV